MAAVALSKKRFASTADPLKQERLKGLALIKEVASKVMGEMAASELRKWAQNSISVKKSRQGSYKIATLATSVFKNIERIYLHQKNKKKSCLTGLEMIDCSVDLTSRCFDLFKQQTLDGTVPFFDFANFGLFLKSGCSSFIWLPIKNIKKNQINIIELLTNEYTKTANEMLLQNKKEAAPPKPRTPRVKTPRKPREILTATSSIQVEPLETENDIDFVLAKQADQTEPFPLKDEDVFMGYESS